jgi:hypothetical protein
MILRFLNKYMMFVFLVTVICSLIITVQNVDAGEFPSKTIKEKPSESQEPVQKTKEIELRPSAETSKKGGCLIATAAFGSELAPQVQLLREIRDNVLFSTGSGTRFMDAFDAIYYTFSPTVADWERENPAFKETIKMAITPMLSTLSILNHVEIDSEQEMLGYGIGIILLNIGIYFIAPACFILSLKKLQSRSVKLGVVT